MKNWRIFFLPASTAIREYLVCRIGPYISILTMHRNILGRYGRYSGKTSSHIYDIEIPSRIVIEIRAGGL